MVSFKPCIDLQAKVAIQDLYYTLILSPKLAPALGLHFSAISVTLST